LLPLEKPSCGSDGIGAVLDVERIGSELVDLELAATMLAMGVAEALPTAPQYPRNMKMGIEYDEKHCDLLQ
jgi:hypothetical protein